MSGAGGAGLDPTEPRGTGSSYVLHTVAQLSGGVQTAPDEHHRAAHDLCAERHGRPLTVLLIGIDRLEAQLAAAQRERRETGEHQRRTVGQGLGP